MVTIIILALLIYGIFQFTKYLMSATVNHAQSHIAGSWGWQNPNPEPGDDLITFTKSVTAFVLALLLFSIFFSQSRYSRASVFGLEKSLVMECGVSGIAARQLRRGWGNHREQHKLKRVFVQGIVDVLGCPALPPIS